jgi:acetyl-CoA synthetase
MIAEAIISAYAISKIGAIYLPIFSGFAEGAVASRLQDSAAKVVLTVDGTLRRGKQDVMKPVCDAAVAQSPSVENVVVFERLGVDVPMQAGRDVYWSDWLREVRDRSQFPAVETDSEDTFMLGYTSGTTGRPKGAVLPHAGFLVKIASECAYQTDIHPGKVFFWVTDMGWIMGPLAMVGAHANGAAMVILEGSPDFPGPDRLWQMVERLNVNMLGVSPSLIRALKARGDEWIGGHDLSSLRILGSTGEPWNPEPYHWLADEVCGSRVPIINLSGGTEVAACFLSPYPVEPIKSCSLGGISLGMDMDVFDPDGHSLRDAVGELVCKKPWPSMTRGIWGDPERYIESYWSIYPGVWRHGDWAKIDEDGQWFLYGRSDESINVAGKRLGPAEVESILVSHPAVVEAATIGVPDETKGEAVWCFWVPRDSAGTDVSDELSELVIHELGKPFKPSRIVRVPALPKTRSAKILRRAIRAVAMGDDPGDLSSAENPSALEEIQAALRR